MKQLPDDALVQVAAYFQVLADPTRLRILNTLAQREHSVSELALLCGCSIPNASRHLTQLAQQGLVTRQSRGNSAIYSVADESVYALCDLVCGSIARQFEKAATRQAAFLRPLAPDPTAEQAPAKPGRRTV